MDLKEIKSIIDLMTKNQLSEFELEKPDFKIRVKKGSGVEHGVVAMSPVPMMAPMNAPAAGGAPAPAASAVPAGNFKDIVSPMVGTFYQSPSPDSKPYVNVGQEVNEETVVCIIEAMKVMNEIKAEIKGVVTEVLAENGKPVEFGKPLFRVRPS
jgi:acetyl-CoA carboxylase biotin carboxyl carrier protein